VGVAGPASHCLFGDLDGASLVALVTRPTVRRSSRDLDGTSIIMGVWVVWHSLWDRWLGSKTLGRGCGGLNSGPVGAVRLDQLDP
jgi:hypothetical protein